MNFVIDLDGRLLLGDETRRHGSFSILLTRPGNDNFYSPVRLRASAVDRVRKGVRICWNSDAAPAEVFLNLEEEPEGFMCRLTAKGTGCCIVRLVWELPADDYFPYVPAFMYGRNEGGKSPWATYPQLREAGPPDFGKPWLAEEWLVRTDRSSHGLTSMIGTRGTYGIMGRDVCNFRMGTVAEKTGIGISSPHLGRISFLLGYCNVPYTYSVIPGRNYSGRTEGYINLDRGPVSASLFLYMGPGGSTGTGGSVAEAARRLHKKSYALLHRNLPYKGTIDEAVGDIAGALAEYGYCRQARNFHITLSEETVKREGRGLAFNSGWSGGIRAAYPLLVAGYRTGTGEWVRFAEAMMNNLCTHAISESSGLFHENYDFDTDTWSPRGWWYRMLENPGHSGYVNGQICYYLLTSFLYSRDRAGKERRLWKKTALTVLDRVVERQAADGSFGYTYEEKDGSIRDREGFSGCWFLPALAQAYRMTKEKRYLVSALSARDHYKGFLQGFHAWGGPHDIFKSPDGEGVLAFVTAAKLLHELTGKQEFLEDLWIGLEYEFSWRFCYDVLNEVNPLKSKKWSSTGGSVTSVNNSHIHPMGSAILDSVAYMAEKSGEAYVEARLLDAVKWTLQAYLHVDGDYDWGKKGMINERFCYTDSLLAERYPDGSPSSTWFCGHSWASGAVLEGLVELAERMEAKDSRVRTLLEKEGLLSSNAGR